MTTCPECNDPDTSALTTYAPDENGHRRRYRCCEGCGHQFTTMEILPDAPKPFRRKPGGQATVPLVKHPAIVKIHEIMTTTSARQWEIAKAAGTHRVTLNRWVRGRNAPTITDLEAVLNVCGYTLVPVKLETDDENR